MPTSYVTSLIKIATEQFSQYKNHVETDNVLGPQIKHYWQSLGFGFQSVEVAWSAVFVSWCVKEAGAKSTEFKFSAAHWEFAKKAIANRKDNTGVFRAFDFNEVEPELGDIIQNNRNNNKIDYARAATTTEGYPSHSAIVVAKGVDKDGPFVTTIGGNESNSVRAKRIGLDANGKIVQRKKDPFICVIKDLK
ncbi:DUF2272 domain-containing protein [Mucilaginibacter sp.]|uniref:DUF2272 domain-containing protein n=1 Tax=Mucilaginibacter sp. TaxID=1882438 RepID=UPI002ED40BBE